MLKKFNESWNAWIRDFLHGNHSENRTRSRKLDIFTSTNNWKYSKEDELA
jgi:hypothetical protein